MADRRVIVTTEQDCPQPPRRNGTGRANCHKRGPEAVYSVLKHALVARRPHPHCLVTTPAKQGAWLKRRLPADFLHRLMRRFD